MWRVNPFKFIKKRGICQQGQRPLNRGLFASQDEGDCLRIWKDSVVPPGDAQAVYPKLEESVRE